MTERERAIFALNMRFDIMEKFEDDDDMREFAYAKTVGMADLAYTLDLITLEEWRDVVLERKRIGGK